MDPDPEPAFTSNTIVTIVVLLILLLLSAFFSCSETAYTSSKLIRLENQSKKSRLSKLAFKITNNYDRFLSTILIGNNLVNIAATAVATVFFVRFYGDIGPTIATIVVTIVVLIFGEVSPKSLAREHPEGFAKINAVPLYFFYYLFFPISLLLSGMQKLVKVIFKTRKKKESLTEEEFSMLVEDMNEEGVLNDIEEDIIQNTIEYGDCKVKEVMTKAKEVVFVKATDPIEKIKQTFADSNYSRLIVTKNNSLQSAYGVIHQKDLFEFLVDKETDINKIIIKDPLITKPTNKVSRLLKKMQTERQHMAIVKDDNKVVGIVTMEDILEELVGEIRDENDEDE